MEDKPDVIRLLDALGEYYTRLLRKDLNSLLVEFKKLILIANRADKENKKLHKSDRQKFFAWNKKFEGLLARAVDLG